MPIYEYRCDKCSNIFEQFPSGGEEKNGGPECPRCGAGETSRVFSVFSSSCGAPSSSGGSGGCGSGGFS